MLYPKKIKYKKQFKGKIKGNTERGSKLIFGTFALKSLEITRLKASQIEAARKTLSKKSKKIGQYWIRVFPNIPVTSKPTAIRMGKGKGSFSFWMTRIQKGQILFELSSMDLITAHYILKAVSKKLPMRTKIISKIL